ncbi:MAG: glycosyltransferase family 2 protein [Bacilli bacterium]|jgi:cellulose synthase/poly-beta-1,6-N-acetylglucosamine synthase-like glycosyltransferase|nr:glycosyltransferase family 2 protein [Bacilli bacterium]
MELFNNIIWWVNIAIIIIVASVFLFQLMFMSLCFLKPRKYPKAKTFHDFTVVIRARNEEDVIADAIDSVYRCDYPKDKLRVVVFCHNCTDKTAEIVRAHGARAIEITDHDPKHQKASYCMYWGTQELLKDPKGTYEFFLLIDADNQLDKNYILACNDAADDGVVLGRTFENSKNLTDNLLSCMTGLWYARDDRFACRARSALHFGCVMNGCASMIKSEYLLNWDAMSSSDDIEFTLNRLVKDQKIVEYIDDAIVYEDQPTTLQDVFKRNTRMGNGLNKLFWGIGQKCLIGFFKNLFNPKLPLGTKLSYLDQYWNIGTIPAAFLAMVWFPLYYIYSLCYTGLVGPFVIWGLGSFDIWWFMWFIIAVLLAAYVVPFLIQPFVSYIAEKKRLIIKNKAVMAWSIILFPSFMIVNAVAVVQGILSKPKWGKLKRSKTKVSQ